MQKPVLGVTEIALRVGLHKSTVSRILTGLAAAGYVQRDEETCRFRLGLGLGLIALSELDVRRVAYPELERLTELTDETSALVAVWNGNEAVVVEQIPSPHQVKHTAAIGTRYNKFESSSVRIFLSSLPEARAAALMDQGMIVHAADSGIASSYADHLREVRGAGYAVNDGLTTAEEFGISALVRDYKVVAAAAAVSALLGYTAQRSLGT